MVVVAVVLLGGLASKVTDFLRLLSGGDYNGAATQFVVWLSGVATVVLFALSDFGTEIVINGKTLSDFNLAAQVILGMSSSSLFSVANDALAAIDMTRSSKKPDLFR